MFRRRLCAGEGSRPQCSVLLLCRKAVKEQLNTLGVNTQIKALIKEGKQGAQKGPSGKGSGFTKEQAIEELKVCACMGAACVDNYVMLPVCV